jgi:MinD superfamily P-loop ATPase
METAIISGKGGTGKSSLSAAFATLNGKVVIADCDVDAANLYLLFNPTLEEEAVYISGYKAVINEDLCTGCGICKDYCRFDAISNSNGKIVISEISCDGCFLCSHVCPVNAITMVRNDKSRMYSDRSETGKWSMGGFRPGKKIPESLLAWFGKKQSKQPQKIVLTI